MPQLQLASIGAGVSIACTRRQSTPSSSAESCPRTIGSRRPACSGQRKAPLSRLLGNRLIPVPSQEINFTQSARLARNTYTVSDLNNATESFRRCRPARRLLLNDRGNEHRRAALRRRVSGLPRPREHLLSGQTVPPRNCETMASGASVSSTTAGSEPVREAPASTRSVFRLKHIPDSEIETRPQPSRLKGASQAELTIEPGAPNILQVAVDEWAHCQVFAIRWGASREWQSRVPC